MVLQVHHPESPEDRRDYARSIIRAEAAALEQVAQRLDERFEQAIDLLLPLSGAGAGRLAITGTGKSADIGQKLAGTFSSLGTRAYVLDSTKAMHGDLGVIHPDDVALVLSHSGESEEIVRLLPSLRSLTRAIVGLTGNTRGSLARMATVALLYGPLEEVCPLGLAPSASTTAMLAIGDALAIVLSRQRAFNREDFARYHPAGSLGRKLMPVEAIMRQGDDLRLAGDGETVREVFAHARRSGRRTGAVMLLDAEGRLSGLFTDSDLARLIEQRRESSLDRPIAEVMTRKPLTLSRGAKVAEALELLRQHKISELPIVDDAGKPLGLLDITDLLGLAGEQANQSRPPVRLGA